MRLLSDAGRSGDRSPVEESCSGILPRPTLSPSVIKRPQRSMSIGVCLECLTLDFGPRRERSLVGAFWPAEKSVGRLGDNLLIWRERHRDAIVQAVSTVLTDRQASALPQRHLTPAPARSIASRMGSDSSRCRKDDSRPRLSGCCNGRTSQASRSWNARCRKTYHRTPPVTRIGMAGPHSQPVRWFPALG